MKKITSFEVNNQKVILRCDFNVSFKDGKIISDERIVASLETINYLINHQAKIIIMSHLGKVKTEDDKNINSLYPVYQRLCQLINTKIIFSSATKGKILEDKINSLNPGQILLMENTRFEDLNNNAESNCDDKLSQYWASLGDIFINDAFAMTHRRHASNYGISKYLPSGVGFLIEKEINGLEPVLNPTHPFVVIMGGAKLEDKLDLITKILPKCDYLIVGGGIANTFLSTQYDVGKSLYDKEAKENIKELLTIYKEKIIMPIDVLSLVNDEVIFKRVEDLNREDNIMDIGNDTINLYSKYINKEKTLFINGTVGKYEDERFSNGTKEILLASANSDGQKIIGGGDALSSSEYFKINNFTFKSTGGGATLDYIANGKLKCMED